MAFSSNKLLAIDWDRRNLRLVSVRLRADGVELLKAVSAPIPPGLAMDDAESLGAFIREAVRQAKIGTRRALLSVSRDQVVLNTLPMPPAEANDLPNMVRFQIAKELPFSAEQATIDFAVRGEFDPREASTVLVAAVRNEQLQFYERVAAEAGLTVERIGLRPHANLIAVLAKAADLESKSVLVVDVGPQLSEINIIREGGLAFSRAASVSIPEGERLGEAHLQDSRIESLPLLERQIDEAARQAVGNLMVEVLRSYEAYRATEPAATLDRVVVCGATGLEPQLAETLGARFAVPASLYMPDRALGLSPQRAKELRGFSAALGLAIGHGGKGLGHFDFLHPKKPVSRRAVRLKKVPIAVATACLFVASGVGVYVQTIRPLEARRKELSKQIDAKSKVAKNVEEFAAQLEALEKWQASEQYWPEILARLTELLPSEQEVLVMRADFETRRPPRKSNERPSGMRLRLRTASLGGVNEVAAALRDAGFMEVKAGKEVPFATRQQDVYHFDTGVEAELPRRTAPPKEEQDEVPPPEETTPPSVEPGVGAPADRPGETTGAAPGAASVITGEPQAPEQSARPDEGVPEEETAEGEPVVPADEGEPLPPPPADEESLVPPDGRTPPAAMDEPADESPPSAADDGVEVGGPKAEEGGPLDTPEDEKPADPQGPDSLEPDPESGSMETEGLEHLSLEEKAARLEEAMRNGNSEEDPEELKGLPPPPPPPATTQAARFQQTPRQPGSAGVQPTTQPASAPAGRHVGGGPTTRPATTQPARTTTRPAREGNRPDRIRRGSRRDRGVSVGSPAAAGATSGGGESPPALQDEGGAP